MMETNFDVIIVGAGPAGTTCALNLAPTGLKIALLDKAKFPRDKICGDALSGNVTFELNKLPTTTLKQFNSFKPKKGVQGIRFFAPNNQYIDVPFPNHKKYTELPGYVVRRYDFDNFLLEELKKHPNVKIWEGFKPENLQVTDDEVQITNGQHSLKAQFIVGADGAHSFVAKALDRFEVDKKHYAAGIRVYYENVDGFHHQGAVELHFQADLAPGYFWIFPLTDNMANVGLAVSSDQGGQRQFNLKSKLDEIIRNHPNVAPRFKNAKALETVKGFGLPLGSKKRSLSGDRFLLVGDAASLIDPLTGEGIGNAMISGRLAAEHIMNGFKERNFSSVFNLRYDELIYEKLGAELQLSSKMKKLFKHPRLLNFIAKKAKKNVALQEVLTGMFDDLNLKKKLGDPLFYWRLFISGK
ncbi:geranylgeranyl reductase family protein [Fulvivirgaceae bacterium BMA10]|uniref:Geranylgeranyl reductase family protein n=1 Tax=Splendidivirga corallicola TaxID=3051826 RepID=A0ABT8KJN7_9BACT|nr:geranylgeranyl reductase family protein [Fulvivirgaceae bacterium BMA10]